MKKLQRNSGNSLFLMEMILVLLFLSLSCAACIQIFTAARKNRIQAEQLNQIQALTTSFGETLEGTDGSFSQILVLLPDGTREKNSLIWYYDRTWKTCSEKDAAYEMIFTSAEASEKASEKSGTLSFRELSDDTELYQIDLCFPVSDSQKEADR